MSTEERRESDTGDKKDKAEAIIAEIQGKITKAFDIFDHENNKTVDVRSVNAIEE